MRYYYYYYYNVVFVCNSFIPRFPSYQLLNNGWGMIYPYMYLIGGWSSVSAMLGLDDHLCWRFFLKIHFVSYMLNALYAAWIIQVETSDKGNLSCFLWEGRLVHSCFFSPLLVIYRCVKRFLITNLGRFRLRYFVAWTVVDCWSVIFIT